jgi:hypothetical protein
MRSLPSLRNCRSGKVRYRDKREAIHFLHAIQVKASYQKAQGLAVKHWECRAYECFSCHGYHLTSQPVDATSSQKVPSDGTEVLAA